VGEAVEKLGFSQMMGEETGFPDFYAVDGDFENHPVQLAEVL
jgi:hypothetical protein